MGKEDKKENFVCRNAWSLITQQADEETELQRCCIPLHLRHSEGTTKLPLHLR